MQLSLNSNLILLIQEPGMIQGVEFMNFKFQSDSINTKTSKHPETMSLLNFKFQSDSINTYFLTVFAFLRQDFKFQSDSINTLKTACRKGVN